MEMIPFGYRFATPEWLVNLDGKLDGRLARVNP
jgi:hypothetical protein